MTVRELASRAGLTIFTMPEPDLEVTGGYAGDLLSWVMGRAEPGSAWLTIMSNHNVAAVALMGDVSCVVLTEDVRPDPLLLERCTQQHIDLLGARESTFDMAVRLHELLSA